jgi:hypothetical protein
MKVLLLHSEDSPWQGRWASSRWDLIVDLAFAGRDTYERWSLQCGTPVRSIHEYAGDGESFAWVREVLDNGRNQLVDSMGLDWWEIIAVVEYQQLQALYLLQCLHRQLGHRISYFTTRPSSFSRLLSNVTGNAVPSFKAPAGRAQSFRRSLRSAMKLTPATMLEIACDKWDPQYVLRRHVTQSRRAAAKEPVVVLPSAYCNVTRLLLQYASDVPAKKFLLAATRRSGTSSNLPGNVTQTLLSSYAQPGSASEAEEAELRNRWTRFESTILQQTDALRWSRDAGVWKAFPFQLRTGLRLRNAWHKLLREEPVVGVLCADDLNYYTRIPLILAGNMGLNAVYCYHGALDGGLLFKKPHAARYLVEGEMEKDYLLHRSLVDPDLVEIGAPSSYSVGHARPLRGNSGKIVFFSQPYEVLTGRPAEIYREVLPQLCAVGQRTGHRVMVKLHPFESAKGRKKLLQSVLTNEELPLVDISSECSLQTVLADAWCGIGVDSSVAAECSPAGVPYFLCGWLDFGGFGYSRQLARFGAGRMLEQPGELAELPEMIASSPVPIASQQLCKTIAPGLLEKILFTRCEVGLKQCAS